MLCQDRGPRVGTVIRVIKNMNIYTLLKKRSFIIQKKKKEIKIKFLRLYTLSFPQKEIWKESS